MLTSSMPSVKSTALEPEILALKAAGFADLVKFDWLDPRPRSCCSGARGT